MRDGDPAEATSVNTLDLDAEIAALDVPRVRLGGVEHVGRLVSLEEFIVLERRLTAFRAAGDPRALRLLVRDLTDALFPPPPAPPDPRPWWRRALRLGPVPELPPSVSDLLLRQPLPVQMTAVERFTEALTASLAMEAQAETTETPEGTSAPGTRTARDASARAPLVLD